jgi:hypothetical protein
MHVMQRNHVCMRCGGAWHGVMAQCDPFARVACISMYITFRLNTFEVFAQDPKNKAYYWHSDTNKTQWEKPTADTPIK